MVNTHEMKTVLIIFIKSVLIIYSPYRNDMSAVFCWTSAGILFVLIL